MNNVSRFLCMLTMALLTFSTTAFARAPAQDLVFAALGSATVVDTASPACLAVAPASGQAVLDYVAPDTSPDTVTVIDQMLSYDPVATPDNRIATCIDQRIPHTGSKHLAHALKRARLQAVNVSTGFNAHAIRPG